VGSVQGSTPVEVNPPLLFVLMEKLKRNISEY